MSGSIGIAVGTAVAVALLSLLITRDLGSNPIVTPELQAQLNFDNINFLTNGQVGQVLSNTTATAEQVTEALRINAEARLQALKITLLLLAGMALLAVIPAGRMPGFQPGDLPVGYPPKPVKSKKN